MKKHLIFLFSLTFYLQAEILDKIEFTGDIDLISGEFDRSTLLKVCHIDYPAIYKIWKKNPTFDETDIPEYVENLEKYAQSMGYYRADISGKVVDDTMLLSIVKNQAIKMKRIEIEESFKKFLLIKEGERFKTSDFTQSKGKLVSYLTKNGYPAYSMNAKAYVDLEAYVVDVNISIDKGEKRYFSTTKLNNSSKVRDELIYKELEYEEGELYNVLKLEESYENLYRLGVFESIKVKVDINGTETPINIFLEQGESKEFASHVGYDTEDGARGGVEYIDHNFNGNLRVFRAGGELGERGHKVYTSYYEPRLKVPLLGKMTFLNELEYHNWDYDAYVEKLFVERVTLGKIFIGLEHYFGFQTEHSEISTPIANFLAGTYLLNSLFYRVEIDKRDSKLDAKNGYYTALYIEKSMKQLGSDIDYLKLLAEARYIKAYEPMIFAAKIKVGQLSKSTPIFKHFFLGGALSNRGYEYRSLGRLVSSYPIGGISMIDASFESRYYLTDDFSMVGFMDASKLSEEVNDFSGQWYQSYGVGVRYNSVIGPLRLDVGYPTKGGFALHLGIGQVF